MDIENYTDN